jgi:hypothetical protein
MAAKKKTIKVAAVPPTKPLDYVLWDGTDAIDSQVLGKGLSRLGWTNQVDSNDQFAIKAPAMPAVLQPAGASGLDISKELLWRGMFELPQAVLGEPLQGNGARHAGSIIAVSAHGVPGFMFSESLVPLAMSRPMSTTATSWTELPGNWSYQTSPTWPAKTKVAIFSACRQLQGKPQQFYWSETMRGSDPPHAILSYRDTAPPADVGVGINERFLHSLAAGKTFLKAWKAAHAGSALSYRWAALCHEAAVDDTLVDWMSLGSFPARPNPKGKILYFDADTPAGREVHRVTADVDCWLTERGRSARIPPWYLLPTDCKLDLHIRILSLGESLQPDDRITIVASQIRPDYRAPFSVQDVLTIDGQDQLRQEGLLTTSQLFHRRSPEYGDDAYELIYRPAPWLRPLDVKGPELVLPIQVLSAPNEHYPIFYFYVGIAGAGKRTFGYQYGTPLHDAFQYCMFLLSRRR